MVKFLTVVAITVSMIALAHAEGPETRKTDYTAVATSINEMMRAYHYDPAELDTPGYKQVEAIVAKLAETATSDETFIEGFREIWKNGPFSHVELSTAQQSADDLAAYLDTLRIGGGGAVLAWQDKTAILTVTTMMGLVPIMIGTGTGSDVMKRMAAPMFGGLLTSFAMELLIYPVIFLIAMQFRMRGKFRDAA